LVDLVLQAAEHFEGLDYPMMAPLAAADTCRSY
jgi:hypothetical protein